VYEYLCERMIENEKLGASEINRSVRKCIYTYKSYHFYRKKADRIVV